jgi:hypothetical protein
MTKTRSMVPLPGQTFRPVIAPPAPGPGMPSNCPGLQMAPSRASRSQLHSAQPA